MRSSDTFNTCRCVRV